MVAEFSFHLTCDITKRRPTVKGGNVKCYQPPLNIEDCQAVFQHLEDHRFTMSMTLEFEEQENELLPAPAPPMDQANRTEAD